jgi:hypothetical protein
MSHRPTFQLVTLAMLAALVGGSAQAQTFYFKDGRKASMPEAKISGTNIIVPLKIEGGGSAESTLPISSLRNIDWPAPEALAKAEADIAADKPREALQKIDGILAAQEVLREVPGSWWTRGAVIKTVALAKLGRDTEADVMIGRLQQAKAAPADINRAETAIINALITAGKVVQAQPRLDALLKNATDDETLAALALTRGMLLERAGKDEEALLSYLRVPVFSSNVESQQPAALAAAARIMRKLGDETRAAATETTLATKFPNSPQAAQLKR